MACVRNILIPVLYAVGSSSMRSKASSASSASAFADYKRRYERTYPNEGDEHRMRAEVFHKRLVEIEAHNARGLSWKMGLNHLTDWTFDELKVLNGHRPAMRSKSVETGSLLELEGNQHSCVSHNESCTGSSCCTGFTCSTNGICIPTKTAGSFDWSVELETAHKIVEQGSCGSCWAVAATAALNMHAEIVSSKQFTQVLSPQSILACSPNKLECGGQGGCKGGTAEVAYDWVKSMGAMGGVQTLDKEPYTATDSTCSSVKSSFLQATAPPAVSIKGWKKIQENDATEMMNALVTVGPLVTSIAANGLFGYSSGVIAGCSDNVINHAVVLMGFGQDHDYSMSYWNVRNSWGQDWGENGFFRLRRAGQGKKEPCGWDEKPEEGVVCKDREHGKYPTKQWVCGECGFLIDTAYPIGTRVPQELFDTRHVEKQGDDGEDRTAIIGDERIETVQDNTWCKTKCQHFGMKQLSEMFDGADFGTDPTACARKCDEHVPL